MTTTDMQEALKFIDEQLTEYLEGMPNDETSRRLRDTARAALASRPDARGASCICPAQPGEDCQLTVEQCNARSSAAQADERGAIPADCDVRKILLKVVPGDGSGFEVYAKNIGDVEQLFREMGERLENFESSRAAAPQSEAAQGVPVWMPIDTAPKTGRTLLLGYPNALGKWRTTRGQWMSENYIAEYWEDPDDAKPGWYETPVEAEEIPNCWFIKPTHWMPLPAAPNAAPSPDREQGGEAQPVIAFNDGARVVLDAWTGGRHEAGSFGELTLRFIDDDGKSTVREYRAKDASPSRECGERQAASVPTLGDQGEFIDIVFDGPPNHNPGRFVEVEDHAGNSISFGKWVWRDDGYWALRIASHQPSSAIAQNAAPTVTQPLTKEQIEQAATAICAFARALLAKGE